MPKRKKRIRPPSGIYEIHCYVTKKSYIGSSKNVFGRLEEHRFSLRQGYHTNHKMQQEWDEYGEEAFSFEVLTLCEIAELVDQEQWFLSMGNAQYNKIWTAIQNPHWN